MEEGDDEAELASRKKKGKVGNHRLERKRSSFHFSLLVLWIHLFQSFPLTTAGSPQHPGRRPLQGDVWKPRLPGGRAERGVPPPQPHRLQGGTEEEEEDASAGSAGCLCRTGDSELGCWLVLSYFPDRKGKFYSYVLWSLCRLRPVLRAKKEYYITLAFSV